MKWYWVIILLSGFNSGNAQTITTFAGCGSSCTLLGDGGPATAAVVLSPNGGCFDRYGNYYFTSATGQRVRRVDTAGIISTVAGTGSGGYSGDGMQATSSLLSSPAAVIVDTFGNMYIADANNHRIRKLNIVTGIISTIAGNGTGGYLGEGTPASSSAISTPQDICFDKKGNLYIADQDNLRVRRINTSGIISTFAGSGGFSATGTGDGNPATAATFNIITGLAADDTGNIFIADYNGGKVRKVDTFGIITTVAGNGTLTYTGDGIPATNAQFSPGRLTIDSAGCVIIGDRVNERVYRVDHAGIFHTIAGTGSSVYGGDGGPATAAAFDLGGISFDACWNLYITDINNRRIRKVTYNPTCDPHSHAHFDSASLNINIKSKGNISIYPNPAYTSITITAPNKINQITITNLIGQTVYTQAYDVEKAEINISGLPDGVYIVKITDIEGKTTINKIVKQ